MPDPPTLLRVLVDQRHWQKFEIFVTQYEHAANELAGTEHDPRLRGLSIAKRQFERWLAGSLKTRPYPDHCRVLEHLFGHPVAELLAPASQEPAPPRPDARPSAESGGRPSVSAIVLNVEGTEQSASTETEKGAWGAGAPSVPRGWRPCDQQMIGLRGEAIEHDVVMTAHESSAHAGFVASHTLDPTSLEQLHDDVVQLARRYGNTPPVVLYGDAKRVRNLGFQLLDRTKRPEQEHDLYLTIGQACGLLASASFDLSCRDAATEQARSAWIYGKHIGHGGLCAWALGMRALIAYWSDRPLDALTLAHQAQASSPAGTALVRLRCIEARAWSHLGDAGQTGHAIAAARDARDNANSRDDLHDEIGGEFGFDEAREARCNGSAYLELGDAESAVTETGRAIELLAEMPPGQRWLKVEAQAHTDLCAAYLLRSQLDGAREALAPVFAIPPGLRIEGLTQRLGRVRRLLARRALRTCREARELGEQIEDFTAHALGPMLPGLGPAVLGP